MSFLNIALVGRERALVAVDTDAVDAAGRRFPVAKLVPFTHLPAIVAFRGSLAAGHTAIGLLQAARVLRSVDDLMASAGECLEQACGLVRGQEAAILGRGGQQFAAVGYSTLRRQMAGIVYEWTERDGLKSEVVDGDWIAPWDDSFEAAVPTIDSATAMASLFRRQVALHAGRFRREAGGGSMVLADVARGAILVTTGL